MYVQRELIWADACSYVHFYRLTIRAMIYDIASYRTASSETRSATKLDKRLEKDLEITVIKVAMKVHFLKNATASEDKSNWNNLI